MANCAACGTEDYTVHPVTELCRTCQDELGQPSEHEQEDAEDGNPSAASSILLTTEAGPSLSIKERLGIVSAECVLGQHIFKDVAAGVRDLFGGRSKTMQKGLREAKTIVLNELTHEASLLGADAVVAVQLHYASVAGAGSVNMLLLTATGTAVRISPQSLEKTL